MGPRMRRRITTAKREEIQKQQDELSHTIVRPFEVVANLPVSYNCPPYGHFEDVLKNPLTTKDSGVFYKSLMKSRWNYVFVAPMFKLYWLKQSAYAKKIQQLEQRTPGTKYQKADRFSDREPILSSDTSARDVMVKLCDASLSLGPHNFEIRLFIAKDERSEKGAKKEDGFIKKDSSNAGLSGELVAGDNSGLSKGQEMEKAPENLPAENMPAENTPVETSKSTAAHSTNFTEENAKQIDGTSVDSTSNNDNDKAATDTQETKPSEASEESKKNKIANLSSKKQGKASSQSKSSKTIAALTSKNGELPENTENATASANTTTLLSNSSGWTSPLPALSLNQVQISAQPNDLRATTEPIPKSESSNMQSIENTIMIANLNAIARVDQSLNSLMKIVALGSASPQQIITFQGYIQRAREMGPQPHHAYLFPDGRLPTQLTRGRKPSGEPKEKKVSKYKVPKEQRLTAFQEKYFHDATILFEFVENPNVRYMLPQNALCEVVEAENNTTNEQEVRDMIMSFLWVHNENEINEYKKKLKEYEAWKAENADPGTQDMTDSDGKSVENSNETHKEDQSLDESKDSEKQDESGLNEENDTNLHVSSPNTNQDDSNSTSEVKNDISQAGRVRPVRKGRRRRGNILQTRRHTQRKKPPVAPQEPETRFTALSLTIHNIPLRFVPIMENSFKPQAKVKEDMSQILRDGNRTASFYLWYQIDGKLDESLAENIRVQLNQEEKKMQGVINSLSTVSSGQPGRKRKIKDKDEESKPKKSKAESVSDTMLSLGGISQNTEVSVTPRIENATLVGQTVPTAIEQVKSE